MILIRNEKNEAGRKGEQNGVFFCPFLAKVGAEVVYRRRNLVEREREKERNSMREIERGKLLVER